MMSDRERIPPLPSFSAPPERVVSLVPSITESLFDLGFGQAVVGATEFCIYPEKGLQGVPRVGGTKNARVPEVLALQPDLVLANREENNRQAVEEIRQAGVPVWVTEPQTVQEALEVLRRLAGLWDSRSAMQQVDVLERSLEWARAAAQGKPPLRYFCPVWQGETGSGERWWMVFNRHTYPHDLLATFGGENIFAERERRYPLEADLGQASAQSAGERDTRYPRLTLSEIRAGQPELVLLPSEPYPFDQRHRQELLGFLEGTPAARLGRIELLDGSLITWHGTRLARALNQLPPLFPD